MIEGKIKNNSGQSMLFMVMSLSSIIVMVASLSSLIMVFELRQATDSRATGEAIMAADTGVECSIYREFYGDPPAICGTGEAGRGTLAGGAAFEFNRKPEDTSGPQRIITWTSAGEDAKGRAVRALEIKFVEQR
jgi:hypothetical protein